MGRIDQSELKPLLLGAEMPVGLESGVGGRGVGFALSIYDHFTAVVSKTYDRVENCDCHDETGCPSCLMSSQCGNENISLHKSATTLILSELLDRTTE